MNSPDLAHTAWRKSSYSANGANCVEVAVTGRADGRLVMVRDSKDPQGPLLLFTRAEWATFTACPPEHV